MHSRVLLPTILIFTVLLAIAGCLDREEVVTIDADGAAKLELKFHTTDEADLDGPDAVPTMAGGWLTERWSELDDEGEEHFHLKAEQLFGSGEPLPDSYAALDGTDRDVVLRFPTRRVIEDRRDGVYMHFHRTYPARPWAYLAAPRELMEARVREIIDDRDFDQLSLVERRQVLHAMATYELLKYTTFARRAWLEVAGDVPQDGWLAVHASLRPLTDVIDFARIAELIGADDDDAAGEAIEEEGRRFEEAADRTLRSVLREGGWLSGRRLDEFFGRFEHHERFHEITEDLGDDNFKITVRMPGVIVGHNGDSVRGNAVTWSFAGTMMRDRDIELMVTVRLGES